MITRRTAVLIAVAIALGVARWIDAVWLTPDLQATVPAVELRRDVAGAAGSRASGPEAGLTSETSTPGSAESVSVAAAAPATDSEVNLFVARDAGVAAAAEPPTPPVELSDASAMPPSPEPPPAPTEASDDVNGAPAQAPAEPPLSIVGTWQDPRGRSALVLGADGVVQAYPGTRIDATFRLRSLEPGVAVFERSTDGGLLRLTLPPAQASQE